MERAELIACVEDALDAIDSHPLTTLRAIAYCCRLSPLPDYVKSAIREHAFDLYIRGAGREPQVLLAAYESASLKLDDYQSAAANESEQEILQILQDYLSLVTHCLIIYMTATGTEGWISPDYMEFDLDLLYEAAERYKSTLRRYHDRVDQFVAAVEANQAKAS